MRTIHETNLLGDRPPMTGSGRTVAVLAAEVHQGLDRLRAALGLLQAGRERALAEARELHLNGHREQAAAAWARAEGISRRIRTTTQAIAAQHRRLTAIQANQRIAPGRRISAPSPSGDAPSSTQISPRAPGAVQALVAFLSQTAGGRPTLMQVLSPPRPTAYSSIDRPPPVRAVPNGRIRPRETRLEYSRRLGSLVAAAAARPEVRWVFLQL